MPELPISAMSPAIDTISAPIVPSRYNLTETTMSTHDNEKNIAIPPDVLEQAARQAQAEGKTVDELAKEAIERHLAQRTLERFKRDAQIRRGNKTDEEVEAIVDKAIREFRNKNRSR
jgi:hypothetical protein